MWFFVLQEATMLEDLMLANLATIRKLRKEKCRLKLLLFTHERRCPLTKKGAKEDSQQNLLEPIELTSSDFSGDDE